VCAAGFATRGKAKQHRFLSCRQRGTATWLIVLAEESLICKIFGAENRMPKQLLKKWRERAFAPVDSASLAAFRIAFGLLMTWDVWRFFSHHRISPYWLEPRLLFKYYGFSWVQPWPGNGLYIHWAILGVLAVFIAAGFLYRPSVILFCLGYTYTFLLDASRWLNHTYFVCLLSFLLIFIPAHRGYSIDAWLRPRLRVAQVPALCLWVLRAQMGVVYFFAGVAKISSDWLAGEPMRVWLYHNDGLPIPALNRLMQTPAGVLTMSWMGMLLDLGIVPFLLWKRTRTWAFCIAVTFHLLNARLFYIGFFPWLAIAGTTVFLSPSWPRQLFAFLTRRTVTFASPAMGPVSVLRQRLALSAAGIYVAVQLLVPIRFFAYSGGIEWWHSEHRFTWRMMLVKQTVRSFFYVTDPNNGETFQAQPGDYLDHWQVQRMGWRPDLLVQFAHYLGHVMPRSGFKPLRVEARVLVSINGRKPELIIDPNVDLADEPAPLGRPRWLKRIDTPLPPLAARIGAESDQAALDEE